MLQQCQQPPTTATPIGTKPTAPSSSSLFTPSTAGGLSSPKMRLLTAEEAAWVERLRSSEYGQAHLIPEDEDLDVEGLKRMISQVIELDRTTPGGLLDYLVRGRKLLEESKEERNPYDLYTPECPEGPELKTGSDEFLAYEATGILNCDKLAFVLVAGGLGERLGYADIKVSLPIDVYTQMTYLEYYVRCIQSIATLGGGGKKKEGSDVVVGCLPPLAIMTSGDTHEKTVRLLEEENYFGVDPSRITVMQQQKVPAMVDSNAKLAVSPEDRFELETKPHGHGDVHVLLHQTGLPQKWIDEGRTHMLIFQDTNGLVFHPLMAFLGVSVKHNFAMNSLCISRKPGEAVGGVCKLVPKSECKTAEQITINVEYNHLAPLLASSGFGGDIADPKTNNSPFPGNGNILLFHLESYNSVLNSSGGVVPEFVNPKYKFGSRDEFKTPTRLECLMQDIPKLFPKDMKAGVTICDRWLAFSTVKNNPKDAAIRASQGCAPEAPFSAEMDQSFANMEMLRIAAELEFVKDFRLPAKEELLQQTWLGITCTVGPLVIIHPSFGICLTQLRERLHLLRRLHLTPSSLLYLEGPGVRIVDLALNGAAALVAPDEKTPAHFDLGKVENEGFHMEPVDANDESAPLCLRVRGYRIRTPESMAFPKGNVQAPPAAAAGAKSPQSV